MVRSREVVIVGAGLFGSIAGKLARNRGHRVTVIDSNEPHAASKASGCVLAPSWLSSLSKEDAQKGMEVLRETYNVINVDFKTNVIGRTFKASRVDPLEILEPSPVIGKVTNVGNGKVWVEKEQFDGIVLVAAGVWSADLVPMPSIKALYGASVRFRAHIPHPQIHVYAPYRQAVAFQLRPREVWFGDGTALVRKTWEVGREDRIRRTIERGEVMLKLQLGRDVKFTHIVTEGARPYVEGHKAGYFARVHPKTWVSTGGAKNGTVLAALQASRFIEEAGL